MASSPSSSTSEPAIIEQVITEFFAKSVHIILESRSPYVSSRNYSADPFISSPSSSSSSSSFRPRDKWFNLALKECPAALENFDLWRQSNLEPLVVDVILNRRKSVRDLSCPSPGGFFVRNLSFGRDEFGCDNRSEMTVERWIVQYESQSRSLLAREPCSYLGNKKGSRAASYLSEFQVMYKKAYRRIIVLLRSLYAAVRLLPAYKLFRDLNASGQIRPLSLSHRISSFVAPFSRKEDAEMSHLGFGPLDTFFGRLSLSVTYLKTIEDVVSEPSTPISTQFIMDYVGSPLADPLKRFQSLPSAGSAPSCALFSRRHSWSNDHGETPSFSLSPSPTYSDSRTLGCNLNSRLPPRHHLPDSSASPCSFPQNLSASYTKIFDEYRPSPPYSRSSSPSPLSHLHKALLRSESAPVSIPLPKQNGCSGGQSQGLPPSPYSKSQSQGCPSQEDSLETQANTTSASQTFSPENKLQLKKESLRLMEFQTGMFLPKILSSGVDNAGNLLKIPTNAQPQIPSRSSSRLSFMDEFDDSGFTCPFAEDDEEFTISCRAESAKGKDPSGDNLGSGELMPIRRSPDAAVGALVWMLKTAPPLRRDNSNASRSMEVIKDEVSRQKSQHEKTENSKEDDVEKVDTTSCLNITASDLFKSRTTADALEELMTYKNMREVMLQQGGYEIQDGKHGSKSYHGDPSEA